MATSIRRSRRRTLISGAGRSLEDAPRCSENEWVIGGSTFVLGQSKAFQQTLREVELIARYDVTILVEGESGTGKELLSRAIHYLSPRSARPFVAVNCASLPRDLLENELFGHRRGAYTDAHSEEGGLLTEAEGGTLFLDEVTSLDIGLQSKLLRFLDHGEYRRVGDSQTRVANIRIVAACNTCLRTDADQGRFRWDLYYRLVRYPLRLPPLRERPDDIPLLVNHFIRRYSGQFNLPAPRLTPSALSRLSTHLWPGNVRELENVILQTVLRHSGKEVDFIPLQNADRPLRSDSHLVGNQTLIDAPFQQRKSEVVHRFEHAYLCELMTKHRGNVSQAARASGKHRRALMLLLNKHHLSPNQFRP